MSFSTCVSCPFAPRPLVCATSSASRRSPRPSGPAPGSYFASAAAWESVRARDAAALARSELDRQLRDTWDACLRETDKNRKGALLEEVLDTLFRTMPGFVVFSRNRRNDIEEMDLVVRMESSDPFWRDEGQYLLVECKHWSSPVPRHEFDSLRAKMNRKHKRCRLGLFVALGGFTRPFRSMATLVSSESHDLVLPVERERLERWIGAGDRVQFLKLLHGEVTKGQRVKRLRLGARDLGRLICADLDPSPADQRRPWFYLASRRTSSSHRGKRRLDNKPCRASSRCRRRASTNTR